MCAFFDSVDVENLIWIRFSTIRQVCLRSDMWLNGWNSAWSRNSTWDEKLIWIFEVIQLEGNKEKFGKEFNWHLFTIESFSVNKCHVILQQPKQFCYFETSKFKIRNLNVFKSRYLGRYAISIVVFSQA